jgi:hypothetical protein
MTGDGDTLVSVLVPALNEAANVGRAYAEITRVFDGLPGYRCEIIFTDNHSTDATFTLLIRGSASFALPEISDINDRCWSPTRTRGAHARCRSIATCRTRRT